ncbi:PmoA family protein [Lacipirellula parvula]|uniref:Methane oxygenase PmoA n=1 Tax=Lacipirellula parvula TaxID=2650471 RepID=A0A5K7XEC3_9BACT|nr:PmoA family protein [Lacipirellula parvula]BBO34838.1 hypothetical protein PLANPX_4450 [Lacipirellula parvula]
MIQPVPKTLLSALCFVGALAAASSAAEPKLTVSEEPDGATVYVDGEVFARYLKRSGTRPVLWPINGPTGAPVTRRYPVGGRGPGEEIDHVHHRSAWFGYEGVNGFDFWHEPEPGVKRPYPAGTVAHREFVRLDSNDKAAVVGARNDWLDPSGKAIAHDERLLEFGATSDARWIDFRIRLWSADGPLTIGDTKEGLFAVRVGSTMRVDAKQGGRIVNSHGETDGATWGKEAEWVDYQGPVDGEQVGIAIFADPKSKYGMPRWHVRPYGLHAANPFGKAAYSGDANEKGGLTVPAGESVDLRYRIYLHRGDEVVGNVAEAYEAFAK